MGINKGNNFVMCCSVELDSDSEIVIMKAVIAIFQLFIY